MKYQVLESCHIKRGTVTRQSTVGYGTCTREADSNPVDREYSNPMPQSPNLRHVGSCQLGPRAPLRFESCEMSLAGVHHSRGSNEQL